ncbi:hypothetical protein PV328_007431 [Microctonus aethiopoides]|uniref:Uncharacterized protein n=1 Tax=Microctonus aethiopoides TaxID=144406 RepID=A0AA39EYI0_9HYME|nr:hypothetical protein PV328_007431 [Microctonus aethiopoides]
MVDYKSYCQYVDDIKSYAKENGLSESETNEIFNNVFDEFETKFSRRLKIFFSIIKWFIQFFVGLILLLIVLYNHPSTHNLFLRNMQYYIYPGFNILRKIAIPILKKYPSLTEYYDESCLLENGNFYVSEMDCWPCSTINSIPDGTGWNITKNFNFGMPFIRSENGSNVKLSALVNSYNENDNKKIFDDDSGRIVSNNSSYRVIGDLFDKRFDENPSKDKDTRILWRINRMKPARILRKLFPKPVGTPDWWGQSTERFLFIDEPKTPAYQFPNPECSNVILRCTSGSRLIKMLPSPECRQTCKRSAVILSAGQTLWYNWWYWRPMSLPISNSTEISINYLTSFC